MTNHAVQLSGGGVPDYGGSTPAGPVMEVVRRLTLSAQYQRMWWVYLLSAFIGGVVAVAALIIALAIVSKGGNVLSIHLGGQGITFYKDLELFESTVRSGGIYVKYKNTGEKLAATACFRVRVYNKDGQLIAESEESVYDEIAPGEIQEHIIASQDLEHDWVHDPDNKIDVVFRYGYLE